MVRYGSTVCAADHHQYILLNLDSKQTLPLFPYDSQLGYPLMAVIYENEFLLVLSGGDGKALGLFVTAQGEPTRGTIEWPSFPLSIGNLTFFIYLNFIYISTLFIMTC